MDDRIAELLEDIRKLEAELAREIEARRVEMGVRLEAGRVRFEREVLARHKALRTGVARFLARSGLLALLTAPFVYAMILPLLLMDAFAAIFQLVCFSMWEVPKVRRADYLVIDRQHLAYLNGIEKLNCVYCGYANGLIAYVREIAARTEQYWCPIKHASRTKGAHERYFDFADYGDAENLPERWEEFRKDLRKDKRDEE